MTQHENAIELLKTVKTVTQWNEAREIIKRVFPTASLFIIDASGLIVKVLGKDHY